MASFSISSNSSSLKSTAACQLCPKTESGSRLTLEVGLDTRRSDRLGQGVDSPLDEPAEEDVGSLSVVLLGNLGDDRVLTQRLSVGTTERRVGTWENVVLLQPGDELVLRALDGKLDLVWMLEDVQVSGADAKLTGNGLNGGNLEELLGSANVEVGNTDRLGQTGIDELV